MLNNQQIKDSEKCEELQAQGEDMECVGCSCSVCLAQEPSVRKFVLPILKLNTTPGEQLDKISEEFTEVMDAHVNEEGVDRELEECFDLIVATTNHMYLIAKHEEIVESGEKVFKKLQGRGHEIIGLLNVSLG